MKRTLEQIITSPRSKRNFCDWLRKTPERRFPHNDTWARSCPLATWLSAQVGEQVVVGVECCYLYSNIRPLVMPTWMKLFVTEVGISNQQTRTATEYLNTWRTLNRRRAK